MLELLMVIAILGITFTIGAVGSRNILTRQENSAAMRSVKQLFWQGATVAASRSVNLELVRNNQTLVLRTVGTNPTTYRTVTLPNSVTSNLPSSDSVIATFSSPGKVNINTGVSNPFTVSFDNKTYNLTVSQIGEVLEAVTP
jgi:Tfp pilus assembly protein FimT